MHRKRVEVNDVVVCTTPIGTRIATVGDMYNAVRKVCADSVHIQFRHDTLATLLLLGLHGPSGFKTRISEKKTLRIKECNSELCKGCTFGTCYWKRDVLDQGVCSLKTHKVSIDMLFPNNAGEERAMNSIIMDPSNQGALATMTYVIGAIAFMFERSKNKMEIIHEMYGAEILSMFLAASKRISTLRKHYTENLQTTLISEIPNGDIKSQLALIMAYSLSEKHWVTFDANHKALEDYAPKLRVAILGTHVDSVHEDEATTQAKFAKHNWPMPGSASAAAGSGSSAEVHLDGSGSCVDCHEESPRRAPKEEVALQLDPLILEQLYTSVRKEEDECRIDLLTTLPESKFRQINEDLSQALDSLLSAKKAVADGKSAEWQKFQDQIDAEEVKLAEFEDQVKSKKAEIQLMQKQLAELPTGEEDLADWRAMNGGWKEKLCEQFEISLEIASYEIAQQKLATRRAEKKANKTASSSPSPVPTGDDRSIVDSATVDV